LLNGIIGGGDGAVWGRPPTLNLETLMGYLLRRLLGFSGAGWEHAGIVGQFDWTKN